MAASRYDVLYLIYDKPEIEVVSFIRHIEEHVDVTIIKNPVSLSDPTHFGDIYRAFDSMLDKAQKAHPNTELTIQITSGTPAMTAVSILLGKAKYSTKFVQSSIEQGVSEPDLPFDIFADFLPALAKRTEAKFSSLFSGQTPNTVAFADILTQSDIMCWRDDPILILQTLNNRLMQANQKAQQALLDQYKSELEGISLRWSTDAKEKAERILNSSLDASKIAMEQLLRVDSKEVLTMIKAEMSESINRISRPIQDARRIGFMNIIASCITLLAVAVLLWTTTHL